MMNDPRHLPAQPAAPDSGKTVAEILAEIVWLMTQDSAGREMKVAEIEMLIMPAILQKRFHIKYTQVSNMQQPEETRLQPIEAFTYALPRPSNDPAKKFETLAAFSLKAGAVHK